MSQDVWVVAETLRGEVKEITYTLLAAGRVLADGLGGKLTALLLGHEDEGLADTLGAADTVLYMDHPALADFTPDAYRRTIAAAAKEAAPRVLLFGHTSIGTDVACGVSLDLGAPLVSSCQSVRVEAGQPWYVCLTCGGKIVAEGEMPEPGCVVTVTPGGHKPEAGRAAGPKEIVRVSPPAPLDDLRVRLLQYCEPEAGDVDIAKESVLVAVGRGLQNPDNLDLAQALAEALGGKVCGSRPVVDQGWLPLSRLVGKSGKEVKPKLYLALGISGAPEHVEGIAGAETIVAVNTDPGAPIFNLAHYGAVVSLFDLAPVLVEKLRAA
jgi:electron transfer flavoprotein alpha subunit